LKKDIGWVQASGIADNGNIFYSLTVDLGGAYIGDLDIDAATVRNLQPIPTPRGQASVRPIWSPDGSHLLINRWEVSVPRSPETPRVQVVSLDIATGQERVVLPPKETYLSPDQGVKEPLLYHAAWAPDGKSLVFVLFSKPGIPPRFVLADLQTGRVHSQVDLADANAMSGYLLPVVAPDGKHVYIAKGINPANMSRLVRIDLQTGGEKEICAARPATWSVSPDGSQIACAGFGDSIRILSTQGGPERDLVKGDQFGFMTWTADGQYLIYTVLDSTPGPRRAGSYWIISSAGGKPRKLDIGVGIVGAMSIHPNNRRIALSTGAQATELWVLENALRASK
jgi:Tol biopolymer transport system component